MPVDDLAQLRDSMLADLADLDAGAERLKQLENDGIVRRDVTPSTPVLIEYHLTEEGRDLETVIEELRRWAERWADAPVAP